MKPIKFAILNLGKYEDTYHSELVLYHPNGFSTPKEVCLSLRRHFGWWYKNNYLNNIKRLRKFRGGFANSSGYLSFERYVHQLSSGTFQSGSIDSIENCFNAYCGDGWWSRGSEVLLETRRGDKIIVITTAAMVLDKINKPNVVDIDGLDVITK